MDWIGNRTSYLCLLNLEILLEYRQLSLLELHILPDLDNLLLALFLVLDQLQDTFGHQNKLLQQRKQLISGLELFTLFFLQSGSDCVIDELYVLEQPFVAVVGFAVRTVQKQDLVVITF